MSYAPATDAKTFVDDESMALPRSGFAGIDASRFNVVREIGRGGMGLVFEAVDSDSGQRVALKTLQSATAQALYRFKREFRELVDVRHPSLVELHELHNAGSDWFFTMELIDGVDLNDWVDAETSDPTTRLQRVRELLPPLLTGLDAIHRSGHLHRDIKPQNIMVRRSGGPVILDFGLVGGLGRGTGTDQGIAGTIAYMAPEQSAGLPLGPAADYYSLATVLYEAIAGRLPYAGSPSALLMAKRSAEAPRLRDLVPSCDPALDEIVAGLLVPEADDRLSVDKIFVLAGVERESASPAVRELLEFGTSEDLVVGREKELEALHDGLALARGGRQVSMVVEGAVGIGKSALLREFQRQLRKRHPNLVVLAGRCHQREVVRFNAFDSIVDALSHELKRLPPPLLLAMVPEDFPCAAHLFPVLGRVRGPLANAEKLPDPVQRLRRGLQAVSEVFARFAAHLPPLVLLFDDLQWADEDSRELLRELRRELAHSPVLIVATTREKQGDLDELIGLKRRTLTLGLLDLSHAERLWGRWGASGAQPPEFGDGVHPLFLRELALWNQAADELGEDSAMVDLATLCRARVEDLDPCDRERFATVASAGRPVSLDVLTATLELPRDELIRWGRDMARRDYLRVLRIEDRRYLEPSHTAMALAGRELFDERWQRDLHLRIASQMEGSDELIDVRARAHHLLCAGERAGASSAVLEAGRRNLELLAFDDAARDFLEALRLGGVEDDLEVHGLAARALDHAGRGAEAADHYLVVAHCRAGDERLQLLLQASDNLMRTGHLEEAQEVCASVLRQVGLPVRPGLRGSMWATIRSAAILRLTNFRTHLRPGIDPPAEDLARLRALQSVGRDVGIIDPMGAAEYMFAEVRLALRIGEPHMVVERLAVSALHLGVGQARGVRRGHALIERCNEILARHPDARLERWVQGLEGMLTQYSGDPAAAATVLEEVEAWFERNTVGEQWYLDLLRTHKMLSLEQLGRYGDLREEVERYAREAERCGAKSFQRGLTFYEARVHLMRDRPEEAVRITNDRLGDMDNPTARWVALNTQGANLLYLGPEAKTEELEAHLVSVVAFRREFYARSIALVGMQQATLEARLRLALWTRGPGSHERAIRRCTRRLRRHSLPWARAQATLLGALADHVAGRDAKALVQLRGLIPSLRKASLQHLLAATHLAIARIDPGAESSLVEARAWARGSRVRDLDKLMRVFLPGG